MDLKILSWDGLTVINDGKTFSAYLLKGLRNQAEVQPVYVERSDNWPEYAGKQLPAQTLVLGIEIHGEPDVQIDRIKQMFNTSDRRMKRLVAIDNKSGIRYYIDGTPIRQAFETNQVVITLTLADPIWRSVDRFTSLWSGITASGATHTITIAKGNLSALPVYRFTPRVAKGSGFLFQKWIPIYNPTTRALPDYPYEITGGGMDTATLVGPDPEHPLKMRPDGNDIRVFAKGSEISRWLADMYTDHTQVWTVLSFSPGVAATLSQPIGASGVVPTLTLSNVAGLGKSGIALIGTEAFGYSGISGNTLLNVQRAARGTEMASHAAGTAVYWIEHDVWLVYGDLEAGAPYVNDAIQPVFNMSTSTNTSWVYDNFTTTAGTGAGAWKPAVVKSSKKSSDTYTATHGEDADPASVMGMSLIVGVKSGSRPVAEKGEVEWRLSHPAGITAVTAGGSKFTLTATAWKAKTKAALQILKPAKKEAWLDIWAEGIPSPNAWTPWSHAGASLGSVQYLIRFVLSGGVGATTDNHANFEVDSLTLALYSGAVPVTGSGSLVAEQVDTYFLDATLTNVSTGKCIRLRYPMRLGKTLEVDTAGQTVTYDNVTNALAALSWGDVSQEWLALITAGDTAVVDGVPTVIESNTLKYEEALIGSVDIEITWQLRGL